MIELEVKYRLDQPPSGISALRPLTAKRQSDIYYDTPDYALLQGGNFLRVRDGKKMEFKIDLEDNSHLFCKETSFDIADLPRHLPAINSVLESLGLPRSAEFTTFEGFSATNRLRVIAPISKNRTSYDFGGGCTVSIDEVDDLGWFLEAEIMIDGESIPPAEAERAREQLADRLISAGLLTADSPAVNVGYVELYLLKHNKAAYDLGKFKL